MVKLTFNSFSTESYDYVKLYDGYDSSKPLIAILYGSIDLSLPYTSTQRYMFITFTSDETITSSGFSANYTTPRPREPSAVSQTRLAVWNSLLDVVVSPKSTNRPRFKNRLDKFCANQEFKFLSHFVIIGMDLEAIVQIV